MWSVRCCAAARVVFRWDTNAFVCDEYFFLVATNFFLQIFTQKQTKNYPIRSFDSILLNVYFVYLQKFNVSNIFFQGNETSLPMEMCSNCKYILNMKKNQFFRVNHLFRVCLLPYVRFRYIVTFYPCHTAGNSIPISFFLNDDLTNGFLSIPLELEYIFFDDTIKRNFSKNTLPEKFNVNTT